jgi:extracellular elastinolytic metalloproteinase
MYLWSTATPYRDGDLEAGIVIHEYSHGLSTRLTGGPMNSGCLGYGEAGGMGEGWGDAMATFIRQIEEYSTHGVYSMGAWAANTEKGIRNYKYSSNSTINPSTYKTLDKPGYWGVHAIGEVWAEFLFVLEELLISKHGFSKTLFPPEDPSKSNDYYRDLAGLDAQGKPKPLVPKHGNTLTVQLVVDAMKLQPCRPSFANARDAIIAADVALTGGENTCDIWTAFAGRGLGVDAKIKGQLPWGGGIREEDYTMPKSCKKHKGKH